MFIVAWTGGLDQPSFKLELTKEAAYKTYDEWVELAKDSTDGDWLTILRISFDGELDVIEQS